MDRNASLSVRKYFFKGSFGPSRSWINFWVLQWIGLRLCYQERQGTKFVPASTGRPGRVAEKMVEVKERRLGIMIGAVPLTGYYFRWRYIFGRPLYIWGNYGERS